MRTQLKWAGDTELDRKYGRW